MVGRVRVDTPRAVMVPKVVNVVTHDAMTVSNSAVHRAVSADRLVAMMLKAMPSNLRAVIQVEVQPVTLKVRNADERDTDKAERGIDAGTLKAKRAINKPDIHHGHHTAVRVEPTAISVRHVAIRTIKTQERLRRSPPTMTSVEDVGASSRTTRRSRHSANVPRVRHVLLDHVRLGRPEAIAHNVGDMHPTMRRRSRNRREATRLSADRFADRAATDKRAIANCRLADEASDRLRRRGP